ncbi:MAG: NADP-dependent isocitrate dehydrogenase [Spirochaetia bacterium]|nr:NADP-dependent isocitrate dehydrogenase [Spirochaetia bacterium]
MEYDKVKVPSQAQAIAIKNGQLNVSDHPIILFIEGDGAGLDIWTTTVKVLDAAVEKAYAGKRKIAWTEIYAGEKSNLIYGADTWLPDETLNALREFKVALKGPLNNVHSLNETLQQSLDLYTSLKPVKYFLGIPSPVKRPENVSMVVFRENSEGVFAGIEFEADSIASDKIKNILEEEGLLNKVRFPDNVSFGIKPVSKEGSQRLMRAAITYAIKNKLPSITIVHKANTMLTEDYFVKRAYEVAKDEFSKETISWEDCGGNPPPGLILIKDIDAETFLHLSLTKPEDYSVIVAMNLIGGYISNALNAQVGGIGIAPGANINFETGLAIFEATHCAAPKYAGLNKVNPLSLILSGVMMLRFIEWDEAADNIENAIKKVIAQKTVTYDFARFMDGAKEVTCSEFGELLVKNLP